MYTEVGKFLRHLRIDCNETLKDMAERLEVSSSFISAIENGKKSISNGLYDKLIKEYSLTAEQIVKFRDAVDLSSSTITINLENSSPEKQRLGVLFARTFEDIDNDTIIKIRNIIQKGNKI